MAMTKKEQEYVENLKVQLALKFTPKIECDVPIPKEWNEIVNGYSYNAYSKRVEKSCSSGGYHSRNDWDKTTSQQPIEQFSTRLKALKAMRNEMENNFAKELRSVDKMIEAEEQAAQDVRP